MRILVCGGRDFDDYNLLSRTLHDVIQSAVKSPTENIYENTVIIHGCAKGADTLVNRWAFTNAIPIEYFLPKWDEYGKTAGVIRNRTMLRKGKPDLVIAFPGGKRTANMIGIAREAGVKVMEIKHAN